MNLISNRQVICDVLMQHAETDKDIVVVCSDSRGSASLSPFADKFPKQFVEVGIAEQNLISTSAGLATCGKRVFSVSPASFVSTRSYEQVKVDVAYSRTNVKVVGISGGVSYGALGMTHHSCQDIAAMTAIPDMRVYIPSDRFLTEKLVGELLQDDKPAYLRVSRHPSCDIYDENLSFKLDKAIVAKAGVDVAIIACGEMVSIAIETTEKLELQGLSVAVVDMYCLKPFDKETLLKTTKDVKLVITIEEHSVFGGLGAMVSQVISANSPKKVVNMSLPDTHLVAGTGKEIFDHYHLNAEGVAKLVLENIE